MQAALESTVSLKRIGGKCEGEVIEESVSNKPSKRQTKRKTKKQVSIIDEDDEVTVSDNQNDNTMMLEDTGKSKDVNIQVNNYVPTTTLIPVQAENPIPVQTNNEVYFNIMQEPIINISQS